MTLNQTQITDNGVIPQITEHLKAFNDMCKIAKDGTIPLTDKILLLKGAFDSLSSSSKKVVLGMSGIVYAIKKTVQFAGVGERLSGLVTQSGLAADKFQALANAAKKYGGSAEETAKSVELLRKGLSDIQKGGDGDGLKQTLNAFKINPDGLQTTEQLLEVIAGRMETLSSETEKMDFGHALGLDDGTIQTLSGGMKAYREEIEKASIYEVFSPEDIAMAKELWETIRNIGMGVFALVSEVGKLLLPVLLPVFKVIQGIIDIVVQFGGVFAGIFAFFIACIFHATMLVAGIIAIVTGLFMSFWKWIEGLPSIFGEFLGDFETFKEGILQGVQQLGENAVNMFISVKDNLVNFFDFMHSMIVLFVASMIRGFQIIGEQVANIFKGIWNAISGVFGNLVGLVQDIISQVIALMPDWLKNFLMKGTPVGTIAKGVEKAHEDKKDGSHASGLDYVPFDGYIAELHEGESVLPRGAANVWRDLQSGKDAISATANVPLASVPQGAISNAYQNADSSKTINIGDITVQTAATDAGGIASDLVESIKMAFNGLDTGVRA